MSELPANARRRIQIWHRRNPYDTKMNFFICLTIAEHGNITRAAQELFISQPSLSESLTQSGAGIWQNLFLTGTQDGLTPTAFWSAAIWTLPERSWNRLINAWRPIWTNTVRCAAGKLTFGIPIEPRNLPASAGCFRPFCELYPEISVQFKENNSTELDKLMLSGKLDFSVMHYETPRPGHHTTSLWQTILSIW